MIDIQDHLRNRGQVNLFDGKSVSRETPRSHHYHPATNFCRECGVAWEDVTDGFRSPVCTGKALDVLAEELRHVNRVQK